MRGQLDLAGVVKRFGALTAVDHVSLMVPAGSMTALLGPSGCGKTTLLRCIAGLADVDGGSIAVDGVDITGLPPWRRALGMVFQSYALFPHLNVADNVAFGLRMRGIRRPDAAARVQEALALVRLEGLAERRPSQLSGGQQQRAALARALVSEPPVLLLDEPLSALDAKLRLAMRLELRELQRRLGITTIVVTHDQDEAIAMADQVAVMNAGVIEQVASPETVYRSPATPFVAEFVGRTNRLEGRIDATGAFQVTGLPRSIALHPGHGFASGTSVLALLRPEHLLLTIGADDAGTHRDRDSDGRHPGHGAAVAPSGTGETRIAATVADVVFAGDRVEIVLGCGPLELLAVGPSRSQSGVPRRGDSVGVTWHDGDLMLWPRG
jgi:ABC-type Fe3+/spermidine/putrescine transport system ATPase subunit